GGAQERSLAVDGDEQLSVLGPACRILQGTRVPPTVLLLEVTVDPVRGHRQLPHRGKLLGASGTHVDIAHETSPSGRLGCSCGRVFRQAVDTTPHAADTATQAADTAPQSAGCSATFIAASGPWSSSTRKPSSSRTGIFNCTALSYFEPGASPTTTNAVFFDTEPAALPPRAMMASLASSRENSRNVPVTTMESPSRFRGTDVSRSASMRTPARRHFSTISRCQSTANHSRTALAMVGPTPSTSASRSSLAASIASMEPNSRASACAAVGPTCRIDSPTRTFHNGRSLAAARLSSRRRPLADSCPDLVTNRSTRLRSSSVRSNTSPSSAITPDRSRAPAAS